MSDTPATEPVAQPSADVPDPVVRWLDAPQDAQARQDALNGAEGTALEGVLKHAEEVLNAREVTPEAAQGWAELARVWEEGAQRTDRAEQAWIRAMAADPASTAPIQALADLMERLGRFVDLAGLLERLAWSTKEGTARAMVLEKLGLLQDDKLAQSDKALVSLLGAFRADPTRLAALRAARAIHVRNAREELAKQLLDTEAEALKEQNPTEEQLAVLAEAYVVLAQALVTRPALHKVALDAAERAITLGGENPKAVAARTAVQEFAERWQEHVRQLRDEALEARDKRTASNRYLSISQIYHQYGKDTDRALEFLDKSLLLTPGHRPSLKFLEQVHRANGTTDRLLDRLKKLAVDARDPDVAVEIHLMTAVLLAEQQAPREELAAAYSQVLDLDAANKSALNALLEVRLEAREYDEAVARLSAYAQATRNAVERKWALHTLARLEDVELGNVDAAIGRYEAILELDSQDKDSLESLERLYARANRPQDYARVLEALRAAASDDRERLRCLDLLARTYASELRLPDLAFEAHRQAFLLDPRPARESELLRLGEQVNRSGDLGDAFQKASARIPGGPDKNTLLIKAARQFQQAQDARRARGALDQVLAVDPGNRAALDILESLSARGADARELVTALRARLQAGVAPADRRGLLVRLARLQADELREVQEAVATWREVLALDSDDREALAALDDLLRKDERWGDLAGVLRARLQAQPDAPDAAALRIRLARVCEERLDRPEEAADLYLQQVGTEPGRADVLGALERLLARNVQPVRIATVLEPIYARTGAWRRYVEMLEIRRAGHDNAAERVKMAREAARIFEGELRSPREAFKALCTALMDAPDDPDLPTELDRLATQARTQTEYVDALLAASQALGEGNARVALLLRRASLLADVLGRDGDAVAAHRQLVASHPRLLQSWDALIRLHSRRGEWEPAADALEAAAGAAAQQDRPSYLTRLGEVCLKELRDHARAAAAYEPLRATLDEKARENALAALDACYMQLKQPSALAAVLADRAALATGPARAEFRARLAEVSLDALQDIPRALEAAEGALESDAQNERARAVLERVLDTVTVEEARRTATRLLEPVYRASSDARGLARVLQARMELAARPEERRGLVVALAATWARDLRQPQQALEMLGTHLRRDPQDEAARRELESVARFAGRPEVVAQVWEAILQEHSGAVAEEYARRLGTLHERAGDREAALKAWSVVLAAHPDDPEALQASVRLRRLSSDARPLAETLEQMAETQAGEQKAASLREAASIWMRVGDPERANAALDRALAAHPTDMSVLRALSELHDHRDDDTSLVEVLARLADLVPDPERSAIRVRMGRLRLEKLAQAGAAVEVLGQVLAGQPSDVARGEAVALLETVARSNSPQGVDATTVLTEHYHAAHAPAPLAALLEHRAAILPDAADRARVLDEVSRLFEQDLQQKDQAFVSACRALRDEPTQERHDRAAALAEATHAWDAFGGVVEDVAEAMTTTDPVGAAERWRQVARIAVDKLSDRALAIRAHRETLKLVPGDSEALAALEDFHRAGAETAALVDILKAKAASLAAGPERRDSLLQAARLLIDDRGDLAGAETVYRQLLADRPDDAEALALLDGLYVRSNQGEQLVEVLGMRIKHEADTHARALLAARLGRLMMESGGGALPAFGVLQTAAQDDVQAQEVTHALTQLLEVARQAGVPPVRDVARVLESCLRARNDVATLPNVLEARLVGEPDPAERAAVLLELARVHQELARNPTLAFMAICRAVREAPADESIRERAETLAQATDSMEALAAVYEDVLEETRDGRLQALLSRRVATISETRLQDVDAAIHHLRNALLAAPDDIPTLEQMVRLLRQKGPSADLMDVLRRLSRQHSTAGRADPARAGVEELAGVADALGDPGGAIAAWVEVLQLQPGHRAALKALERLYLKTERYQELATILEQEIAVAPLPAEAAEMRIKLAEVRRAQLADPIAAALVLQQAAVDAPGNPRLLPVLEACYQDLAVRVGPEAGNARQALATLLEPRYEALGDAQKLVSVLEAQLDGAMEPEQRRNIWRRVAGLREGPLQSPELAFAALGRALKEYPGDEGLRMDAERLAQIIGDLDTLVGLYQDVLEQEPTGPLALLYRRRVAILFETGLQDLPRAIENYRLVVDGLGPAENDTEEQRQLRMELLQTLERLHRTTNEPAALADVLRRRAALATDERVSRQLMLEVARLQSDLQDNAGSIATLKRMLDANPQDMDVLRMLQQACEKQERWPDLVEALMREAELTKGTYPDRELDARYRAGVILDTELDRTDDALTQLYQVLSRKPDHPATRAYLEDRLRTRATQRTLTGPLLLEAYRATSEWQRAIDVLEQLVSDAEVAGDRDRARQMLTEIADIFEKQLELTGPAFGALCRALKVDRSSANIRTRLLDLARKQGTVEELAEVYEDEASGADLEGRTQVAAELREAAARLHEDELEASDRAVELYEQVLVKLPGRITPLEALQRLYGKASRWQDLEATVRKRLAVSDGAEERGPLLRALGSVLGRHLGAIDEAVESLEEAFRLDGGSPQTRTELIFVYGEKGQWDKQAQLMEQELAWQKEQGNTPAVHTLQKALVKLLAGSLNQLEEALVHLVDLRAAFPRDVDVFESLERLLRGLEKWVELKALYEEELAVEKDSGRVTDLSARLGQVLTEHLGEVEGAIQKYAKVLELDPRDLGSLDALRRIYRKAQRWDDLVGILRRLRRLQTDSTGIKSVQFDLAEVFHAQDKRADAIEAGRRVLDIEPHTEDELVRLFELFHACEAWEECAGVMERRVALAESDPPRRMELLFQLAELWEGPLARKERASTAYERILQQDASHVGAYTRLADVYNHAEDWRKLVALNEQRLGFATEQAEKVRLLTDITGLYEHRLGEKSLAFLAACRAFRENPVDRSLCNTLERLALETESAEEMVAVLEDTVARVDDTNVAIEIYLKMAEMCAEHTGEPDEAEAHLNLIFDLDAQHQGALNALEKLYTNQNRFADVIRVMERRYGTLDDEELKKQLLYRIAGIWEEKLEDPAEAINTFKRVLELDGKDARAVQGLTRLYEETGRWQALIGMYMRAQELSDTPQERVPLLYRIAGIQETELQDLETAIQTYRQVLDEDPSHSLALKALERIYTQMDRYPELFQVFERQMQHVPETDTEERCRLLARMAALQEETFGNLKAAVQYTERILEVDPRNAQAVRKLQLLFREMGDSQRLIQALQRHAEVTTDNDEKLDLQLQIAEIYYRDLNKPDRAEDIYNRVLQYDPGSIRAIHALGQLYERSGNWFNALEKLAHEANLLQGRPEAVETYFRMGTINADMLMDTAAARQCYETALGLDSDHVPSLQALKAIHYAAKEWDQYLRRLVEEAEATKDPVQKTELFASAGAFVQERNADLDGAARYYERALQITPDHLGAAKPLADIEFRREGFARAEELLEIVVAKLDPANDTRELCRQYYRLGYITEKQTKDQKALKNYQRAYDIDPTYLPALEGLGAALLKAERWEEAQKVYQNIIIHHQESLTDAEVVDYHYKLGDIFQRLEQEDRAVRSLEKALEIDTNHAPSLKLLASVHEAAGRFEEAYDSLSKLVGLTGGEDRVKLLMRIGSLSQNELTDPYRAIDAYEEANRLQKDSHEILTALLALYRETKQGPKAVESLEDLVRLEADEATRVRLNHTLGEVYRDEVRNEQRAVQFFNAALDLDPTYVRSFEAIERLLTEKRMWRELEVNYRAMIQRTPKEQVKIRTVLWKNLAELYNKVLKDMENAIMAYGVLLKTEPDNLVYAETLAELLAKAGKEDEAIAQYNLVLPRSEAPAPHLQALQKLYRSRRQLDRAFSVIQALRIMGEANQDQMAYLNAYAPHAPARAQKAMTEKLWDARLVHERAKTPVAHVSELLYRYAPNLALRDLRDLGLHKRKDAERIEVEQTLVYSIKQMAAVMGVFGLKALEVWKLKGHDMPPTLHPVMPVTLTIGDQNPMFKEMKLPLQWALWGRTLSYLRPAFILPRTLGPAAFRPLLEAALYIKDTTARFATDPKDLDKLARQLIKIDGLEAALRRVEGATSRTAPPDLDTLYEGMEHTAVRASLIAGNDVDIAVQCLRIPDPQSPPPTKNRLRELILFLVSDEYAELRTRLGLAIRAG